MDKMTDEEFNEHLREIFPEEAFQEENVFNYHHSYLIEGLLELSMKAQEIEIECEEDYPVFSSIRNNARCIQTCINFIGYMLDKDQWNQCITNRLVK